MKKIGFLVLAIQTAFASVTLAQDSGSESINRSLVKDVDELTTRVLQNKILWTGDYTGFVDNFVEQNDVRETKDSAGGILRHRLRLGLRATPNEIFRFTGRLAAYKNFLTLDSQNANITSQNRTYSSLRPSSDALLRIDRMYMDIFPSARWISGAFGLFPSSEGLPSDLHRLQPRKSTYSNITFNVPFAAAVLALHPGELFTALPESHVWLIYSSSFTPAGKTELGYTFEDPVRFLSKNTARIYGIVGEVDPKVPFADSFVAQLSYVMVNDYKIGDEADAAALSSATALSIDPTRTIGDLDRVTLHVQAEHIANTGINFFIAGAMTPQVGEPIEAEVTSTVTSTPGIVGAPYKGKIGLHGAINNDNRFGKALYTGVSYDFKNRINPTFGPPTFGYDFFLPERNYLPVYTAGEDILARTENIGHSHRFFYTQPIADYMKFHLAYTYLFTRYQNNLYEVAIPAQGPATLSGTAVIPATAGASADSVARQHRHLHAVQLSWMLSF